MSCVKFRLDPYFLALFALTSVSCVSTQVVYEPCPEPQSENQLPPQLQPLPTGGRKNNAKIIIQEAKRRGLQHGYLFIGVAWAETSLRHCASSNAKYTGPFHPDCDGYILAGQADGPPEARQGGLGIMQLDAGTHTQTIRQYGAKVLSRRGNINAGIDHLLDDVRRALRSKLKSRRQIIQWMNGIYPGTRRFHEWLDIVLKYYNGCRSDSSRCKARRNNYHSLTLSAFVLSEQLKQSNTTSSVAKRK